jgi:SAM-dependent methyltransferase
VEAATAFDQVATGYDETWTSTSAGRMQRNAVWRYLSEYFHTGDRILDLGCGTGEDAVWLCSKGARVTAIDASPQMVSIARRRGVAAQVLPIEQLQTLRGIYDGAISNFGPLNCLSSLQATSTVLADCIRPGGYLAICVMGRFCLLETVGFLLSGQLRKAVRRWAGFARAESLGIPVTYHSVAQLCRAFEPSFSLVRMAGIGIAVPPSSRLKLSAGMMSRLGAIDRRIECIPVVRGWSDHRLLVFVRK